MTAVIIMVTFGNGTTAQMTRSISSLGSNRGRVRIVFVTPRGSLTLAFASFATFGVIFGYFPARHVAHLDPIQALHYG